jgi:regulator of RNase E activity RraA
MRGPEFARPSAETIEILRKASTATLQTILKRRGVKNAWMPLFPIQKGMKCVGPALTIRSVPGRDDLQPIGYVPGTLFPGHPDDAIDAIQPGDVVVLDGRGVTDEGLFGDLLSRRMHAAGAVGTVSDMCVRDSYHIIEEGIPTFSRGTSSPGGSIFNVDFNVPIGCAGVLVCPGDIISADDDGVMVIPLAMVSEVTEEVQMHEDREDFIRIQLAKGASQRGLYPMGPEWEAKFREWRKQTKGK